MTKHKNERWPTHVLTLNDELLVASLAFTNMNSCGALPTEMRSNEVPSCDVKEMLTSKTVQPDFVVDGIHFGRGDSYICSYTQRNYRYSIAEIRCWQVNEDGLVESQHINHLNSNKSYTVYAKITAQAFDITGASKIDSEEVTHDICFYWKGNKASSGRSPLPQELEEKNPPVERIRQWTELPIFLRLFGGKLVIHDGFSKNNRLFVLRGALEDEIHLIEVSVDKASLRSRTSFLLVQPQNALILIWHGCEANSQNNELLGKVVDDLRKNARDIFDVEVEDGFNVSQLNEGVNDQVFLEALDGRNGSYFSLMNEPHQYGSSPRLFYFNNITGWFLASEVPDLLKSERPNPFPFLQDHLYSAAQPALFLLDNTHEIWLWQGYRPEVLSEDDLNNFKMCSTAFLKTAIEYHKEKYSDEQNKVYFTMAGREPLEFTNLFPIWTPNYHITGQKPIKVDVKENLNVCLKYLINE